jgi:hypothetical protein
MKTTLERVLERINYHQKKCQEYRGGDFFIGLDIYKAIDNKNRFLALVNYQMERLIPSIVTKETNSFGVVGHIDHSVNMFGVRPEMFLKGSERVVIVSGTDLGKTEPFKITLDIPAPDLIHHVKPFPETIPGQKKKRKKNNRKKKSKR